MKKKKKKEIVKYNRSKEEAAFNSVYMFHNIKHNLYFLVNYNICIYICIYCQRVRIHHISNRVHTFYVILTVKVLILLLIHLFFFHSPISYVDIKIVHLRFFVPDYKFRCFLCIKYIYSIIYNIYF